MAPKDPRFSRLGTDPRFLRPSKASQKVVLDDRFKSVLDNAGGDEGQAKVDKYGKKVTKEGKNKALKAFYRLEDKSAKDSRAKLDLARGEGLVESSSEEEDEDEDDGQEDGTAKDVQEDSASSDADSDDDADSDAAEETVLGSKEARRQLARQQREGSAVSIDLDEEAPVASTSALADQDLDEDVPMLENSTKRIAVVNLDWDNVRAIDLYKVFDSVLSSSASSLVDGTSLGSRKSKTKIAKGSVASVTIYPSVFGKKRMEREEMEGPPVEIFSKHRKVITASTGSKSKSKKAAKKPASDNDVYSDSESDNQEEYDEVALRRYQLERLRYYYAVVQFDTVSAAQHAYAEIDGSEYEATANILDLRFVPDDVTFDEKPSDIVSASSAELQGYKPNEFITDALRNSKVKLTWDADDPQRSKLIRGAHPSRDKKQPKGKGKQAEDEIDYSALLASDSEDDAEKRSRLRAAFGLGDMPDEDDEDASDAGGMEVTFGTALDGEVDVDGEDNAGQDDETTLQAYQRKERERRQKKKEKRLAEKKKISGRGRMVHDDDEDSDPDEAFDANAFGEADGLDNEGGLDTFFDGEDVTYEQAGSDTEHNDVSTAKLSKKAQRQLEKEQKAKEAAQLSLLMNGSDDEAGSGNDDGRHFDMQAIMRAEKTSSKPKKMLKKGKDRRKHDDAKKLLSKEQDKFNIDLKDQRFSKLHEDHEFALDPSNAKYLKTANMQKLLDESRKRRSKDAPIENTGSSVTHEKATAGSHSGLDSLVESIKRKSQADGRGKEHKKSKKQKTG